MRVSSTDRSADWIATEYQNQNASAAFYLVGYEEAAAPQTPFEAGWGYRKQIAIDHTKVSGSSDLDDFPVLINTTDLDWRTTGNGGHVAQSDGGDFLFTAADGVTKLHYEIESYDPTTGELVAWVRVPTLDYDQDTILYAYYGNASAVDQWNPEGVWDSDYQGVWHLDEAAGDFGDSTSNANTGTDYVSATDKTGQVGRGQQFDGSDDRIDLPFILNPSSDTWTIGAWFQFSTLPSVKAAHEVNLFPDRWDGHRQNAALRGLWAIYVGRRDQHLRRRQRQRLDGDGCGGHLVLRGAGQDRRHQLLLLRRRGLEGGLHGNRGIGDGRLEAGDAKGNGDPLDGYLDEVRVSSINRSADWIATEYANQNAPAAFYLVGYEEAAAPQTPFEAGWGYRKKITIDHTNVAANLTDFPVLIDLTDDDLRDTGSGGHVGQTDGGGFLFTSSDGSTKLHHEIETYDVVNRRAGGLGQGSAFVVHGGHGHLPLLRQQLGRRPVERRGSLGQQLRGRVAFERRPVGRFPSDPGQHVPRWRRDLPGYDDVWRPGAGPNRRQPGP